MASWEKWCEGAPWGGGHDGGGQLGSCTLLAGLHLWRHHAPDAAGAALLLKRVGRAQVGAAGADVEATNSARAGTLEVLKCISILSHFGF